MVAPRTDITRTDEDLLARLTATAYSVALRHGLQAPFIDVELALWRELRQVLADELPGLPAVSRLRIDVVEAVA